METDSTAVEVNAATTPTKSTPAQPEAPSELSAARAAVESTTTAVSHPTAFITPPAGWVLSAHFITQVALSHSFTVTPPFITTPAGVVL